MASLTRRGKGGYPVTAYATSVGASVSGSILSRNASLISGQGSGQASKSGALLSDSASLIAGSRSGTASVSGATLADVISKISGVGSGQASKVGSLLTDSASLIDGGRSGAAGVSGATLADVISKISGTGSGAANRSGVTTADVASLLGGQTSAAGVAGGANPTANTALIAGSTTAGSASVAGSLIEATVSVILGAATGAANISGTIIVATANLISGIASAGDVNASVNGVILGASTNFFLQLEDAGYLLLEDGISRLITDSEQAVTTSVLSGIATGEVHIVVGGVSGPLLPRFIPVRNASARGRLLKAKARIIPGVANGTITTASITLAGLVAASANIETNNIVVLHPILTSGSAIGERYISDEEFMIILLEAA